MPYSKITDLPAQVKEKLDKEQQKAFMGAFNAAMSGGKKESSAFAIGWNAAKDVNKTSPSMGDVHSPSTKWRKMLDALKKNTLSEKERTPPQAAQNNAKKVLEWKDKHGDEVKGMTDVGWRRARQLADGGALSMDVIERMAQFARHEENAKIEEENEGTPWKDNGRVAWLGWGGDAGINWAKRISGKVNKGDDFTISANVCKLDEDKRLVYGWASVIEENGQPVVDKQGDIIKTDELVEAAHDFMLNHRMAKKMHRGNRVGDVVESMLFTEDVQKSLGIDLGKVGWFIGMKIHDDKTWESFKSGELSAFSIGGKGKRIEYQD